jgi:hypothetical protein
MFLTEVQGLLSTSRDAISLFVRQSSIYNFLPKFMAFFYPRVALCGYQRPKTERLMNGLGSISDKVYPAAWTFPNPAGEHQQIG